MVVVVGGGVCAQMCVLGTGKTQDPISQASLYTLFLEYLSHLS